VAWGYGITTVGLIWALGIVAGRSRSRGLLRIPTRVTFAAIATIVLNGASSLEGGGKKSLIPPTPGLNISLKLVLLRN